MDDARYQQIVADFRASRKRAAGGDEGYWQERTSKANAGTVLVYMRSHLKYLIGGTPESPYAECLKRAEDLAVLIESLPPRVVPVDLQFAVNDFFNEVSRWNRSTKAYAEPPSSPEAWLRGLARLTADVELAAEGIAD